MALHQHTDSMECPTDFPTFDGKSPTKYNPKGPRLPAELWALILNMEQAAITLNLSITSKYEQKERKEAYKAARFALNKYLAERLTKLEGYESVRELRSVPKPRNE